MADNLGTRRKRPKRAIFKDDDQPNDDQILPQTSTSSLSWVDPDNEITTQMNRISTRSKKSPFLKDNTNTHKSTEIFSTSTPAKMKSIEEFFSESDYAQGICPEDLSHTFNTTFNPQTQSKSTEGFEFPSLSFEDVNLDEICQDKIVVDKNTMLEWLPQKFWQLLKEDRGISKLYEWQRDCLTLATTYKDWNLIYSLPTSGGKTLVAEIIMLETLLIRKEDVVLVLPYISLVQEKVRGLSTLASELGFNLEEYAGSKGALPPRRRKRHCLYICTIEKSNSLTTALQDEKRLGEIGLMVVDELHMVGEEGGRGACLESCLAKVMYCEPTVRIVGMSATLANIETIANFLNAKLYTSDFRPVTLHEYFKLGQTIFRVEIENEIPKLFLQRILPNLPSSSKQAQDDPDNITTLVSEVIPEKSCLIFCASKINCQNVALLLTTQLSEQYITHKKQDKIKMLQILNTDASGVCPILRKTIPYGIAYHHSGLTTEERKVIEEGFRDGILCVLTCTSTLAAGVNLPASRVIIRAPYTGAVFLTRTRYVQMVGRAGRAGYGEKGESYVIGESKDKQEIIQLMSAPIESCASTLLSDNCIYLRQLLLSAIGLRIANTNQQIQHLFQKTLLASCIQPEVLINCIMDSIRYLQSNNLIWAAYQSQDSQTELNESDKLEEIPHEDIVERVLVYNVTFLGKAVYKSSLDIDTAAEVLLELEEALTSLLLTTELHLLYLFTPPDLIYSVKPDWKATFNIVTCDGQDELMRFTQRLKVYPGFLSKLMTGTGFNSQGQEVTYRRFYLALLLYRIVSGGEGEAVWKVAEEFRCSRGFIQSLLSSSAARCSCLIRFSEEIQHLWPLHILLPRMLQKVAYASKPELVPLMELSGVGQARARQLIQAGYNSVKHIARSEPLELVHKLTQLNIKQANQIVASAKLLLQEKAEALREEADEIICL
ncbi:Helicase POLQ-like isoform X1 [Oopsacas minuta]|uniref:Helicase POLQ-like isoform X1 n=1 Tax=Oopsacas minuta TaxID=111878 RepID=A0AAV7K6M3_9METZ|nr:Helicase POLQ-like isoform X1 [Oopsacas minuta]